MLLSISPILMMLFFVARDCLGVILAATVADTVGLSSSALGLCEL